MITASDIIKDYALAPLDGEGGFFRFICEFDALGAGSIFYLATEDSFSSLHKLSVGETWVFIAGSPALQLTYDEDADEVRTSTLDRDHECSFVQPGLWQATRSTGPWSLFMTMMKPRYNDSMYTAPYDSLFHKRPELRRWLGA